MAFNTKATEIYIGFWIGFFVTALGFTFLLVNHYTSNHFLKQNNLYIDGKFYKLCPQKAKCS